MFSAQCYIFISHDTHKSWQESSCSAIPKGLANPLKPEANWVWPDATVRCRVAFFSLATPMILKELSLVDQLLRSPPFPLRLERLETCLFSAYLLSSKGKRTTIHKHILLIGNTLLHKTAHTLPFKQRWCRKGQSTPERTVVFFFVFPVSDSLSQSWTKHIFKKLVQTVLYRWVTATEYQNGTTELLSYQGPVKKQLFS